jgi:hypothetical protein
VELPPQAESRRHANVPAANVISRDRFISAPSSRAHYRMTSRGSGGSTAFGFIRRSKGVCGQQLRGAVAGDLARRHSSHQCVRQPKACERSPTTPRHSSDRQRSSPRCLIHAPKVVCRGGRALSLPRGNPDPTKLSGHLDCGEMLAHRGVHDGHTTSSRNYCVPRCKNSQVFPVSNFRNKSAGFLVGPTVWMTAAVVIYLHEKR